MEITQKILLKSYNKYFNKKFIEYFIIPMGGTALGAIRHSDFIPWDDDMDFFITPQSFKKLRKCDDIFLLEPFTKYNSLGMAKALIPDYTTKEFGLRKEDISFANVDLMILCEASSYFTAIIKFYIIRFSVITGVLKRKYGLDFNILFRFTRFLIFKEVKNKKYAFHAVGRAGHKNAIYPYNWFNSSGLVKFNNTNLVNYNGIHNYLIKRYGKSYLNLPSEETKKIYKKHTLGYLNNSNITLLVDGIGVLWEKKIWEEFNKLECNPRIFNFLKNYPGKIIICTNIPLESVNIDFPIYSTNGIYSKLDDQYFKGLFKKFSITKQNFVYIEHDDNVYNKYKNLFEILKWDNKLDVIDAFFVKLSKKLHKLNNIN